MKIVPHIQENEIVKLEVEGRTFSLKGNIPLEELQKIMDHFNYLEKFIDFSIIEKEKPKLEEWTKEEIFNFLDDRNTNQITFFNILYDKGKIGREKVLEEMKKKLDVQKFKGLQLAGILAGIGIRTNRLRKEHLYVKEEKREGDYYFLNGKYAGVVEEWIEKDSS